VSYQQTPAPGPGGPYQQYPPPGWQPQPPPKRKRHIVRNVFLGITGAIVLITVIAVAASGGKANNGASVPPANAGTQAPAADSTSQPPAQQAASAPKYTTAEQQAIDSAESYLSTEPGFSKKGLIQQLDSKDGEGFSKRLAVFAVDHVKVNWWQQAVFAAKSYMKTEPGWSYSGLVQQLDSPYGGDFTQAQAEYAAKKVGL
jgi:Host cell surface-exposed lipoprotein